jgi:hypothetical protein
VTPAEYTRIYRDLKVYADGGLIEYVLPTDPMGERWIVGWHGEILKFTTDEGIVGFMLGIQVAAGFAAKQRIMGRNPWKTLEAVL